MAASDIIAIFAVIISLGSYFISKKSLDFVIAMQKTSESKQIDNEKSELLRQISNNKSILNDVRIEIGVLQANFDAESLSIKKLMGNYTNIFTSTLSKIESTISDLETEYSKLINWSGEMSYSDIMRAKAAYHEDSKQFEMSHEQGIKCVTIFKEVLAQAKSKPA